MDWRERAYYVVSFDWRTYSHRVAKIKFISDKIQFHPFKNIPLQKDEMELRGKYHYLISCPFDCKGSIEYELNKAKRNDGFCEWKEIKQREKIKFQKNKG